MEGRPGRMRVGSMDPIKEVNKSYAHFYLLAIFCAVVLGGLILLAWQFLGVVIKLIIKYWWIALIVLLIILFLRRRRKK